MIDKRARSWGGLALYALLTGAVAMSQEPDRASCNASTVGALWPERANGNYQLSKKLFHCGELMVCSRGKWRYKWTPVSVRLDQLGKHAKPQKPPGCAALMEEIGATEPEDGEGVTQSGSHVASH